jgi:hypothetical protein
MQSMSRALTTLYANISLCHEVCLECQNEKYSIHDCLDSVVVGTGLFDDEAPDSEPQYALNGIAPQLPYVHGAQLQSVRKGGNT